ncbi:hypothetical protein MKX08_008161 [Trichoderma sp. CBMAI-0020]|nr:hypothetical protein MKX08_008161 [Trichoderma sp. CBMAI-0020]
MPDQQHCSKEVDELMENIDEEWSKASTKKLNECIPLLYYAIREALTHGIESEINNGGKILRQIEKRIEGFLGGEGKAQEGQAQRQEKHDELDGCILWIILWLAVSNVSDNDDETSEKRANMIIAIAPWLAFDNPTESIQVDETLEPSLAWVPYNIRNRCKRGTKHDHKDKHWVSTPFHEAAANNNSEAIDYMLTMGAGELLLAKPGASQRQLFIEALQKVNKRKETALSLSARLGHGRTEALNLILDFCKESLDPDNKSFQDALHEGRADVIEAFLDADPSSFVSPGNILKAVTALNEFGPDHAKYQSQVSIVGLLISHTATAKDLDEDTLKLVIQLDLKDMLKGKLENADFGLDDLNPLHLAVEQQSPDFVEMFLKYYPHLITTKRGGKYPLWHNNYEAENKRRRFNGPNNKNKKNTWNDSNCYDQKRKGGYNRGVVRDLSTVWRYVFPPWTSWLKQRKTFGDNVQSEHFEVFQALDWLRRKGVKEIIELVIPDRLVNPHNEIGIGQYVERLKVEVLDWRFLDMSISILNTGKDRIRELHLYTSGKRSAIMHWLSKDGVHSLTNLQKTWDSYHSGLVNDSGIRRQMANLNILKELMSKESRQVTTQFIENNFQALCDDVNERRKGEKGEEYDKLEKNVTVGAWNPTVKRLADLEEISDRAVPKLSKFIRSYSQYVAEGVEFRATKVALIDNGILSVSAKTVGPWDYSSDEWHFDDSSYNAVRPTENTNQEDQDIEDDNSSSSMSQRQKRLSESKILWSRIKDGCSFVDDNSRLSSWLFASHPHGTQMANLICAIDPLYDLYVAKVTEGRYGISPGRVTKAIQWAIGQNVDIIPMSFTILDKTEEFQKACAMAVDAGIVLFCSTHDEGANIATAYPASFSDTIKIMACDEFGAPNRNMKDGYDYTIQGIDVAAGVVPFLESDDRISGSSVATAIAAGLGSLTLSCDRLANGGPSREYSRSGKSELIKACFKDMLAENSDKYILLEKFAGVDRKLKDWTSIFAGDIIEDYFQKGTRMNGLTFR